MTDLQVKHIHTRRAPFLVWPVARREFYAAISAALAFPLLWGVVIFGWRALAVILMALLGAIITHQLLKRFTRRGRELVYAHTILSALIVAALSQALWNPSILFLVGGLVVLFTWAIGGSGHERVHASLVVVLFLSVILGSGQRLRDQGAILARDRLFMGDLAQSAPLRGRGWPASVEIWGQDALQMPRPNVVVVELLERISAVVERARLDPASRPSQLQEQVDQEIINVWVTRLPPLETVMCGLAPGAIGTVSALALILAGLYLAYRNILRPRSCALFLLAAVAGLVLSTFFTWSHGRLLVPGIGGPWQFVSAEEMLALLMYPLFNSDILLAAIFLLALPGTEPITRRGRRWFVLLAGLAAGFLQHADLPLPAATLAVVVFQPFSPLFDAVLGRKSWLGSSVER